MQLSPDAFLSLLQAQRVLPIGVFDDPERVARVAALLMQHGIRIIEVTLRTPAAYRCIEAIRKKVPDIAVGAGSVLSEDAFMTARDAGSQFFVSPCLDEALVSLASRLNVPYIPGVATPTELFNALKWSRIIKIFPVSQLGGPGYLNAIAAPYNTREFNLIPTGGISEKNFAGYLQCDRVIACGMSYPVDRKLLDDGDFTALEKRIDQIATAVRDLPAPAVQ